MDRISRAVLKEVSIFLVNSKEPAAGMTNVRFLAEVGMKRNWKSGCAICLTDKIMGTTCGCGHTEIAVLRPCGHAICASPCFERWLPTVAKDTTLGPQIVRMGGQQYMIGSQKNINIPLKAKCPICRQLTTATFRAEEAYASSDQGLRSVQQKIHQQIMAEIDPNELHLAQNIK